MKYNALVGNCVKCGAPIYDEAETDINPPFPPKHFIINYKMKPKTTCNCLTLKPTLDL